MSGEHIAGSPEQPLVLIVEDEESIALALSFIVEDAGYCPLVATDGKEALELARSRHPALIITDLMMPRMSGRELIARVLGGALGGYRAPIVLLTAADRTFAADSGADAVLAKPFEITAVERVLRRFLG
ncbi:MAG TPA: response regulator [Ktedonobacterales bacterium]